MPQDKLVRVSKKTHHRLTELGKKGETYDHIINRLLKESLTSTAKEIILSNCREVKTILESIHRYPMKSPLQTPVIQRLAQDIKKRIDRIELIAGK